MRTTPLRQWSEQAEKFDKLMRRAIELILAHPMSDFTFSQVALSPKLGGLGLRRVKDHANFAYSASWHEAGKTAKEKWTRPDGVPEESPKQSKASFEHDRKVHAQLVEQAPTQREKQRLRRCAQPHAGGFITALPLKRMAKTRFSSP